MQSFWEKLAKPLEVTPCPVADCSLPYLVGKLAQAGKAHRDLAKVLTEEEAARFDRGGLRYLVWKSLSADNHVVHPMKDLVALLNKVLEGEASCYLAWLLNTGQVVDVSSLMADPNNQWLAWRDNLGAEVEFAWYVVEHCWRGGSIEIICGEPGTGKTEKLARQLALLGNKPMGGSATNKSAQLLSERIRKFNGTLKVKTIHSAFKIKLPVHRQRLKVIRRKVFFADEMGQVCALAAAVMAASWAPRSRVLLSLGPGQLFPAGIGCVGEDLVDWLKQHPDKLPNCHLEELSKNWRFQPPEAPPPGKAVNGNDAVGILRFLRAVVRGERPQEGPGLQIVYCQNEDEVLDQAVSRARELDAPVLVPTRNCAAEVNYGFVVRERQREGKAPVMSEYRAGEVLRVKKVGYLAREAGLRKGTKLVVIADSDRGNDPEALIEVIAPKGLFTRLTMAEVDRANGLTAHEAQGIERGVVVVGLVTSRVTTRRWLYSAASRAKKRCVIFCTGAGLERCIQNDPARRTLLPLLLDRALAEFAGVTPEPACARRKRAPRRGSGGAQGAQTAPP